MVKLTDDQERQLIKERDRAHYAKQIQDNPIWQESKDILLNNLRHSWEDSAATQAEEREKIFLMLAAAKQLFSHIDTVLQTGKMANEQLTQAMEASNE